MRVERLREIRERRGLTQRDLADRVGIHPQQLYRIESGQSDTSSETLTGIAKALDVSLDYLVGLVDEPSDHFSDIDLTAMERRLIWAVRNGLIVEALEAVTAISKGTDQPSVPTH